MGSTFVERGIELLRVGAASAGWGLAGLAGCAALLAIVWVVGGFLEARSPAPLAIELEIADRRAAQEASTASDD